MQFNLYSLTCQEAGKKQSWMESDRLPGFVVGGWTPNLNLLAVLDCSSGSLGVLLPVCAILLLLLFAFFTLFCSNLYNHVPSQKAGGGGSMASLLTDLLLCLVLDFRL